MILRRQRAALDTALAEAPAVALIGPRQAGKTTLALEAAATRPSLYLDLESEADRSRLAQPELFLAAHADKLVVIDEVHRAPGLFPVLRGVIDRARRAGRRHGLFLLLGSASLDLLRQSGESLAGRIRHLELGPFDASELPAEATEALWTRGGFPESFLAEDDARSLRWRRDFIRTYLERDVAQFGPRIAAETLRRFWTMLAHQQGALQNVAGLARSLGVDQKTAGSYLGLLTDLLVVRQLQPWHGNIGKRLVKSPRTYVRDAGLVHALLGIADRDALLGHPVQGASWEGHVIESALACAPEGVQGYFYRTAAGAEVDLVLEWPGNERWAIEIKRSLAPKLERGFHAACADLAPLRRLVVYPGDGRHPVAADVEALTLPMLVAEIIARGPGGRPRVRRT